MPERGSSDWDGYLAAYHDANPGVTEDVLADAHDNRGQCPYDWLLEAVPSGAATVVDLACGSGPVGRLFHAERVVGVDRSAGELGRARASSPSALLVRARADALPIAGGTVDAVVASMALMLLRPLESVLAEAGRLLRGGGAFVATVPTRGTTPGASRAPGFAEILAALGAGREDYPEPLGRRRLQDRFRTAGLALRSDETRLFTRAVQGSGDAALVVRSFYAPGAGPAQVAAAVALLEHGAGSGPVEVGYRLRRLVAER